MTAPATASERITVAAAAAALGLHEQTIRNWIKDGRLRRLELPRRPVYLPVSELVAFGFGPELKAAGYEVAPERPR